MICLLLDINMILKLTFCCCLTFFSNFCYGQIILKDNSVRANQTTHLNQEKLKNIVGYAKYTATIVGYADFCGFSKNEQKIIFDNYFNKIKNLNLSSEQIKVISDSFTETAQEAKGLGVSNSKLTCSQFKVEFDNIIKTISK